MKEIYTRYQQHLISLDNRDAELLYHLSSCYHAIVSSAVDPVTVPNDIFPIKVARTRSIFSRMYWDCHEDESAALEVMQKRIEGAGDDIKNHLKLHESMLAGITVFSREFHANNRSSASSALKDLIGEVQNYGSLVQTHERNFCQYSFLDYPTCFPGHIFHIPSSSILRAHVFNQTNDKRGFYNSLEQFKKVLQEFEHVQAPLPALKLQTIMDLNPAPISASLEGRIALARQLLERAGFQPYVTVQ
ncbi:hypothetical protein HYZ97_02210 [Candidatus Pacearchaeota archaeon]|nr:hypothetical protein [Candidatus Pacearchaeota archaeon]